ncbi:MAG: hypothetical protein LBV54_02700 [Puniceicoccales bacterium]|jgi:hypothetical protein|nr:hypothetical protein [Puniceicoccales bacterium]
MKPATASQHAFSAVGLLLLLAACAFSAPAAHAQSSPDTPGAYRQAAYRGGEAQEGIRKDVDTIQQNLERIIVEMKQNGFDTSELEVLARTANKLSQLSEEDIRKVIAALQTAGATRELTTQQKNLLTAFQGQKEIAFKLRSLASEFTTQQILGTVQLRLQNLMLRQLANIRQTTPRGHGTSISSTLASTEQNMLTAELTIFSQNIQSALKSLPPDTPRTPSQAALATLAAGAARADSESARELIELSRYDESTGKQHAVYNAMLTPMRAILAEQEALTTLEELLRQVEQLTADQQALASMTAQFQPDWHSMAAQEARLEDQVRLAESLSSVPSPRASAALAAACRTMVRGESILRRSNRATEDDPKLTREAQNVLNSALAELKNASQALLKQIAELKRIEAEPPAKRAEELTALLGTLNALHEQIKEEPSRRQGDRLMELAPRALPFSTPAANALHEAAEQLKPPPKPPRSREAPSAKILPEEQAQALNKLESAISELQSELAATEQEAAEMQKKEEASEKLSEAMDAAKQAGQRLEDNSPADAIESVHEAQEELSQVEQDALTPDEQAALKKAQEALTQAEENLQQENPAKAEESLDNAEKLIQEVQGKLAQEMKPKPSKEKKNKGRQKSQGPKSKDNKSQPSGEDQAHELLEASGGGGGPAQVMGKLAAKDREAIEQNANAKVPREYAEAVQQYLKNLGTATEPTDASR